MGRNDFEIFDKIVLVVFAFLMGFAVADTTVGFREGTRWSSGFEHLP
jgi:hypothetical protein